MFSTFKKLCCYKREPKTPLGFCDGPSTCKWSLACCDCSQDRYGQSYDPDNKFHEAVCMGKIKVVLHLLSKKKFTINDQDKGKRWEQLKAKDGRQWRNWVMGKLGTRALAKFQLSVHQSSWHLWSHRDPVSRSSGVGEFPAGLASPHNSSKEHFIEYTLE